ncbi:MAG: glycerol-3-phosphate responsive antiterminator [Oscillospiraceae bacterium]|nr:glycerol-3-phosphate responsive antiterminator [Oscillospiraceae bacterium]
MSDLSDILIENPLIAAVRNDDELEKAALSRVRIVFVLYGSILTLPEICAKLHKAAKTVFVHADMIEGLRGDMAGIEFLNRFASPSGIVSTRPSIIKFAKQLHLQTILRVFLLDSLSLQTGIRNILETNPDAVEIMPGIACRLINEMEREISVPVIAGGLIINKQQVLESLSNGAVAISTSKEELWEL